MPKKSSWQRKLLADDRAPERALRFKNRHNASVHRRCALAWRCANVALADTGSLRSLKLKSAKGLLEMLLKVPSLSAGQLSISNELLNKISLTN